MSNQSKSAVPYVVDWLSKLIAPDQVFEIRGIGNRKYSGFFNYENIQQAALQALNLTDKKEKNQWSCQGVYWTINPLDPSVLSRRANRIEYVGKDFQVSRDADVIRRRWMLVDVDPIRTAGVSSSRDEINAAFELICDVRQYLNDHLTTNPIFANSGNGFHLLYRIDLPNDDHSTKIVRDILRYLASKFDNERAKVDTTVFNASRICKLYGTVSRKGDSTSDRPHRRAWSGKMRVNP
jgi:hypothetical protein